MASKIIFKVQIQSKICFHFRQIYFYSMCVNTIGKYTTVSVAQHALIVNLALEVFSFSKTM